MKKIISLSLLAIVSIGCGSAAQQAQQPTANTNTAIVKSDNPSVVSSHSADSGNTGSMQSNNTASTESPMAKAIDVETMNAEIEKAEREFKQNPKAKDTLAKAYFTRAFALTEAAQYRSALGDFRKGLKLNPNDEDAKLMHDQIITIFKSIGREPPKEGEEPAPLPFNKKS